MLNKEIWVHACGSPSDLLNKWHDGQACLIVFCPDLDVDLMLFFIKAWQEFFMQATESINICTQSTLQYIRMDVPLRTLKNKIYHMEFCINLAKETTVFLTLWRIQGGRPPPGPISFISMQFSGKKGQIIGWRTDAWEILDPPLLRFSHIDWDRISSSPNNQGVFTQTEL